MAMWLSGLVQDQDANGKEKAELVHCKTFTRGKLTFLFFCITFSIVK